MKLCQILVPLLLFVLSGYQAQAWSGSQSSKECMYPGKSYDLSFLGLYEAKIKGSKGLKAFLNFSRLTDGHPPNSVPFYVSFEVSEEDQEKHNLQAKIDFLAGDNLGLVLCLDDYAAIMNPVFERYTPYIQKSYESDLLEELATYSVALQEPNPGEKLKIYTIKIVKTFFRKRRRYTHFGRRSDYLVDHRDILVLDIKHEDGVKALDSARLERKKNMTFDIGEPNLTSQFIVTTDSFKKHKEGLGLMTPDGERCRVTNPRKIQEALSTRTDKMIYRATNGEIKTKRICVD